MFGAGFLLLVIVIVITVGICSTKCDVNYIKAKEKEANLKLELAKSEEAISIAKIEADKEAAKERKSEIKKQQEDERRMTAVRKAFDSQKEWVRKDLKKYLMDELDRGDSTIDEYIRKLINEGILAPTGFNGSLVLVTTETNS